MADLLRERLISAICTAVGGQYGITAPQDERDVPVTVVQDGEDDASTGYDIVQCTMPIGVGRAEAAATNATPAQRRAQAHAALKSLITAMHTDTTFGGLARGADYTGGGIQIEGPLVFAQCTFNVRYAFAAQTPDVAA